MHHDPLNRKREEAEVAVRDLLTAAVELLWREPQASSDWERGITELISRIGYHNNYESAFRAIKDREEEMEQDIADEVEAAKSALEQAAHRLSEAEAKKPKGK